MSRDYDPRPDDRERPDLSRGGRGHAEPRSAAPPQPRDVFSRALRISVVQSHSGSHGPGEPARQVVVDLRRLGHRHRLLGVGGGLLPRTRLDRQQRKLGVQRVNSAKRSK